MQSVLPNALPLAVIGLLSWSCNAELLLGEEDCHGAGVDCDSDVPTRYAFVQDGYRVGAGAGFDVVVSRGVAATWIYDDSTMSTWPQLKPAPGGGVWVLRSFPQSALLRLNAEGEPVESHALDNVGALSVDDELGAVVLGWRDGHPTRTTISPLGEVFERTVGPVAPKQSHSILINGPNGRLRMAAFSRRGSYVAEYDSSTDLTWKQSDVRDARGFPFANLGPGKAPAASYRMVALSDGSLAVAVPKDGDLDVPGLALPEQAQGLTLIEPDGNLRWDLILGESTFTTFLAPGLDGSVVYASGIPEGASGTTPGWMFVHVLDRQGEVTASWIGRRKGFHSVLPQALCTDSAGAIYTVTLTGERDAPLPTICRMNPSAPDDEVVCLGVEDALLPPSDDDTFAMPTLRAITAPEPGVVVFSVEQGELLDEQVISRTRLVRIDF